VRQGKTGGASTISIDLMAKVMAWSAWLLKIAIIALLLSTGYVLYGVYGGHLAQAVDQRILQNLELMGQVMALSGMLAALALIILTPDEFAYAVVAALVGIGYMLGFPLMVAGQVSAQSEQAAEVIARWANTTGEGILVIVGVRVLIEIVNFIREAPTRRARIDAETGIAEKPKVTKRGPAYRLARCWEMPYCHEAIKEMCPAFQRRRSCWRIKQGCNCDPYLIESLLRKGVGKEIGARDAAYLRSDLAGNRRMGTERTRECRSCPIFIEHQRQKFRVLNPLFIAGSIVALLAAYPVMHRLYTAFIEGTAALAHRLAYGTEVPVDEWIRALDTPAVWVFFYIIVGLLVMSYLLKAVEWAVLQRKIL
jgi:hypothetical protein